MMRPGGTVDRYDLLLQHAGEGIYGLDTEGRVTFVNPAAERLLGYSRDELIGRPMHPVVHHARSDGSDYPQSECHIHAVLRDGVTRRIDDEVFWRRDGTPLEVEYTAAAVQEKGRITGAVVLFQDVTERRAMEAALRESESHLATAQAQAKLGSWALDVATNRLYWSAETYRIFGIPHGTTMDYEAFLASVHPEDRGCVDQVWRESVNGGTRYDITHRIVVDGEIKWVRERAEFEFDEHGRMVRGTGTVHDVTDRKQVETDLHETLAYQRRLLDAMSDAGIGLFVVDRDYRVREMNSVLVGAFGDQVGEICYRGVGRTDRPCGYCRLGEVIGEGKAVRYQVKAPNGRIYDITAVPLRGRDGEVAKLEIILDVTEPQLARALLSKQLAVHMFLLDFSRRCISLPSSAVDGAIAETLEDVGQLMEVDRSYIFRIDDGGETISNTHEWCRDGVAPQRDDLQALPFDAAPWWMEQLRRPEVVALSSLDDLPPEAVVERDLLQRQEIRALIAAPIHRQGVLEGFVGLDVVSGKREWASEERQVLEMLANTLSLIFDRRQFEGALLKSQRKLRELAAHREQDREEERARIAREIHDELGQYLTALRMDVALLQTRYGADHPDLSKKIEGMKETISTTVDVVRNIASALRPHALNMGLVYAAEWLLTDLQERTGVRCRLHAPLEHLDVDDERATALFRILQESLTNIARHAQASEVEVRIEQEDDTLSLRVWDNGVGFDPAEVRNRKAFGLMGMRERALILGGNSQVESRPGGGTKLSVRIPCGRTDDERDREKVS